MSDFSTVLIEDSRLQITDQVTYGVVAGAAQSTYQQFAATSASASSLIWNVIVPSEQIVIDKNILFRTQINCTLTITNVPAGGVAFEYGTIGSFQAFPFNHLINTASCSINNSNTSVNQKDVLPALLRLYDRRELNRYRSMTPVALDGAYANFKGAVGFGTAANIFESKSNNPMGSYTQAPLDADFIPRGSYALDAMSVVHTVAGAPPVVNTALISTDLTDTWVIGLSITVTEPMLCLSPFTSTPYGNNQAGLLGINNMNFTLNMDASCSRLFCYSTKHHANLADDAVISITGGATIYGVNLQPFVAPTLLLNLLTLQPSQYAKIKSRNVLPYYDVPRYLSNPTQTAPIAAWVEPNYAGATIEIQKGVLSSAQLTSTSLQLNVIPDKILIFARIPMAQQTIVNTDTFMKINSISVSFNNVSGLLSAAQPQDLYKMSVMNGSNQSWAEFVGFANCTPFNGNASTGYGNLVGTGGSLLVIDPAKNFNLPDFLSNGSLGQFQLQFNLNVSNQYNVAFNPEICVICCNSGIFSTMQGASQFNIGLLTKQKILETKSQDAVASIDTHEYARLVGGRMDDSNLAGLAQLVRKWRMRKGGAMSAGAMSAGGFSGGRLSKHLL